MIVDAFYAAKGSGVLGRMADAIGERLTGSLSVGQTSISNILANVVGDPSLNRKVDVISRNGNGVDQFYRAPVPGDRDDLLSKIRSLNKETNSGTSGIHSSLWSQALVDTEYESAQYISWLNGVDGIDSMPDSQLGASLDQIFKLIKIRDLREVNQDVFSCQVNGFDQHFDMKVALGALFDGMNEPLALFRSALISDGLWDSVTLIMGSEFGRTITPNASGGTDHGYGGNFFMMGGNVKGASIKGTHPSTYCKFFFWCPLLLALCKLTLISCQSSYYRPV